MERERAKNKLRTILLQLEEVHFKLSLAQRQGYLVRKWPDGQRMAGHIECVVNLCHSTLLELELDKELEPTITEDLARYHDLAKCVGDTARVRPPRTRPTGPLMMAIKKQVSRGFSYRDRRKEYEEAIALLAPTYNQTPTLWARINLALRVYYRRTAFRKEAQFVHGMGQVMDIHFYLWALENGMAPRRKTFIRSFTDELSTRLFHWTPQLYWELVKEHYASQLVWAYDGQFQIAMAQ